MKTLIIQRRPSTDSGTFGDATCEDRRWISLELPRRSNEKGVSCIPAGRYECELTFSPRFKKNLYAVKNVPGRDGVRFHAANYAGWEGKTNPRTGQEFKSDLDGCIALGKGEGEMSGQWALKTSGPAMAEFTELMGGEPFDLVIRDA